MRKEFYESCLVVVLCHDTVDIFVEHAQVSSRSQCHHLKSIARYSGRRSPATALAPPRSIVAMLPSPCCPLAGQFRVGQNARVKSMLVFLACYTLTREDKRMYNYRNLQQIL